MGKLIARNSMYYGNIIKYGFDAWSRTLKVLWIILKSMSEPCKDYSAWA